MNTVILIHGKQGAGKTTLADELQTRIGHPCRRFKFASVIYQIHDMVQTTLNTHGIETPGVGAGLLQLLGAYGRNTYGKDVWVKVLRNDVIKYLLVNPGATVIIDDCRYENELSTFNGLPNVNQVFIKLMAHEALRKERCGPKWRPATDHESETGLDHLPETVWDHIFDTSVMSAKDIGALLESEAAI